MTGLIFDIETDSVNSRYAQPPERFFRLGGVMPLDGVVGPQILDSYPAFRDVIRTGDLVAGHNIMAFDLPALGITDLLERTAARRIIDTWTLATVVDPPPDSYQPRDGARRFPTKPEQYKAYYSLDNLAFQYGVPGKTDDLKALAKKHGGFGMIPTDDPEYHAYLRGDVTASRDVLAAMLLRFGQPNDYAWREMRVAAVMSTVSMNGFRLDTKLCQERINANLDVLERGKAWLVENFGLPTTNKAGKESKNPIATQEGKAAILQALYAFGVDPADIPKTAKMQPSLGSDALAAVAAKYPGNAGVEAICETVAGMQGLRTVYQTAAENMHADGFCHPDIFALQASGRLSTQDPGLTVFGKRDGRQIERDIFLPDVLWGESDDPHVLFAADFSQIDARAVAALSQDHNYLAMFEPGVDLHVENAKAAFGAAEYAADPKGRRQDAKIVGHGWNYNMGLRKLAIQVGSETKAQAFDLMMRSRYPALIDWKQRMVELAEYNGVLDNGFGRMMKASRERAYTQGPALMGQGAARDLMFEAILRMAPAAVRMIKALVHDELVFSVPMSIAHEVRRHVVEAMTFDWAPAYASRPVKIEADASDFAFSWGKCYP